MLEQQVDRSETLVMGFIVVAATLCVACVAVWLLVAEAGLRM